jgi:hypothetical protein
MVWEQEHRSRKNLPTQRKDCWRKQQGIHFPCHKTFEPKDEQRPARLPVVLDEVVAICEAVALCDWDG